MNRPRARPAETEPDGPPHWWRRFTRSTISFGAGLWFLVNEFEIRDPHLPERPWTIAAALVLMGYPLAEAVQAALTGRNKP